MSILQGLCEQNGIMYAAWKAGAGDDRMFYSYLNGTNWAPQQLMPGATSVGPSLAVFRGLIYAAWKGIHSDESVSYATFANGRWSSPVVIPGIASSTGPSLAVLGDKLYAAWKGMGTDQSLWYSSFDGVSWTPQSVIPGMASSIGPSLTSFNNRLFMAWRGMNNDQSLWFASFDGSRWSGQQQIPGTASSKGPSLAVFQGRLFAAWKGATGDSGIWYASFDGARWSPQIHIASIGTSIGPALQYRPAANLILRPVTPIKLKAESEADATGSTPVTEHALAHPESILAMWKGMDSDETLWFTTFDGTKWAPQVRMPGTTGQDDPVNIGLRMQFQETNQWCWIAVGMSVIRFYSPSTTLTQCQIMTIIGQNINGFAKDTSACPTDTAIASVPGVDKLLADPYQAAAENVLDNPALGVPAYYIKSGGVSDALKVNNNWASDKASMTLDEIKTEIAARRPICVDIQWIPVTNGQHVVAIAGVLDDKLLICDPASGESTVQYEDFPAQYGGGATIVNFSLTKQGN